MSAINHVCTGALKLEIPQQTLQKLLQTGLLPASECRCLDRQSKQQLWQLILDMGLTENGGLSYE